MGDKRVVTRLCDVISGAERRVLHLRRAAVRDGPADDTQAGAVQHLAGERPPWALRAE